MDLQSQTVAALCEQLKDKAVLRQVALRELIAKSLVPKSFPFGPDICLFDGVKSHLIYSLARPELPDWVVQAPASLKKFNKTKVTILATHTASSVGYKNANRVAKSCIELGYGLASESDDGCFLVFPPSYSMPTRNHVKTEFGHIPSWLLTELANGSGLSTYLRKALTRLNKKYIDSIHDGDCSYEDESQILMDFAHDLRKGDRRLFVPVNQLAVLKEFEHAGGNPGARDHFFHTFNNLLIGLYMLNVLIPDRSRSAVPDRFIGSSNGGNSPDLKVWESLWVLTCLFHDPGYMGENFWSTFAVALGADAKNDHEQPIPDDVVHRINNAWDTEFLEARQDLVELFKRVAGLWDLSGKHGNGALASFDSALRRAYFNGSKCGHSLVSGLNLIKLCRSCRGAKHPKYDEDKALKATIIAALGMMFHDPHARKTLTANGVPAISFEDLPYASALMFADALQDDRRDIQQNCFPKEGVLESIAVRHNEVLATVCLPRIPVQYWPGKIAEYQNVLNWINSVSDTKFKIDYRTKSGF